MNLENITIKEYLTEKGIPFRESGKELITKCLFNNCDRDSRGDEAHMYLSVETGQFNCKKCGEKGNLLTLKKHFGDVAQRLSTLYRGPRFAGALVEKCHQDLPVRIREYLNGRGIKDSVIDAYKLGYGEFYGKRYITIPIAGDEGYKFFKLRQDPEDGDGKITYPKGAEAQLFGAYAGAETQIICEGELDALALISEGFFALTSTHGAGTFKEGWIDEDIKKSKKIYVCFDNDGPGRKGAERVAKMVENGSDKTYIISLPQEVGEGGDITDYLVKLKGDPNDLFGKYAKRLSEWEKTERIKKIDKPKREVSFEEWQETIKHNFPELVFPSEIGLSIMAQILIKEITNPFALVLVDVPSAGKTITINFFSEINELTYASDKFTPASFVSNASNVKKEELADIDLLPRLKYKMFLLRDLSTLFSKRDDDLNECLGLLTRVLDGEGLNTDSGIHGQRQYVGEYLFMILAGSTPIPPRVWKMMGSLGSRLFFLNMGVKEKSEEELAEQLTTLAYKEKEKICRVETRDFLYGLWHKYPDGVEWNKKDDKQEDKIIIVRCAQLLAKLRGVINVWKDRSQDGETYDYTNPIIEKPDRINQLFYNLCRGHALACGRTNVNKEDLRLPLELAIDSAPTVRARLFRKLLENNGEMKTGEVMVALNCSRPTAHKEMEALKILGICYLTQISDGFAGEPEKALRLIDGFKWFLSDECKKLRGIEIELKQDTMADLL